MTRWYEGPLAAFDTETTGVDVEEDRIVSAALVVQDMAGARPRVTRWLIDPGVPVPPGATEVHGLTDDFLHRNGRWPAPAIEEMARALAEQCAAGRPLVVMNAPFDLTLLDRELRRHRASSLARCLENVPLCVLDPRVLDKHLDRYRKGRRTLTDLCAHYEVELDGAHDAAVDAVAALEVVRAVGRRFAARLERLSAAELHTLQAVWHAAQARGLQAWFSRNGTEESVDPAWPLRPELPAAA
ncbi:MULTISPECIES: 3'-5' exonuclease [unclassified Streptomyces]|uniref:3'-5' exonuclease n=1 Tax=unclassified Streptomyces TaxID=2593676 RepID=UPI00081D8AAE|nr:MULTISPECIES: 3'-5' exonuclease [unclassified Streptomyces]MYZ37024.1 3'-5' exonuclease [Streptomyces sp. SID4917]SCF88052.1 DNA polymerase-3 subunit epsilon [Streptomyces sp. MnatMP-M17]